MNKRQLITVLIENNLLNLLPKPENNNKANNTVVIEYEGLSKNNHS